MGNIVHQDEIVQTQTSPGSGWKRLLEPAHASVTIAISLGIALYSFNEFFLSTALPTTVADIGGAKFMSWAYSVFLVLSIIGGMVAAHPAFFAVHSSFMLFIAECVDSPRL